MTAARNASLVLRRLRELAKDEVADHELLERFTVQRDDAAFAALVRRYGRLVSSVCRAVLRNEHDTEDVFQATFLVLARKTASIRKRDALASWLYGVAYRLANKARSQAAKSCRPMPVAPRPEPAEPLQELAWRELNAALHEELAQMPAIYCSPVVLCCLEGCSRDEAARRLGWPMATVKHRLERGRELLRRRLAQRGLAPSAALAAAIMTAGRGAAAPASFIQSTTAGILDGAALSQRAVLLAQGVLQGMFTTKLTIGSILFCGVVLTLLAVDLRGPGPRESIAAAQETKAPQPVARPNKDQPPAQEAQPFPAEPEQGENVMAVKYGSTGEWMATAEMDGTVRLWNTKTQRAGAALRGPKQKMVRSVAFTPDSETLVGGCDDGHIYVWDVRTGKLRTILKGHRGSVVSVALASDGKTLASGSCIIEPGAQVRRELKIWDLAAQKLVRNIACQDDIASGGACGFAFAPGTQLLAAACCGEFHGIKVWDTSTGKEVKQFTYDGGFPLAVAISPDGKWLAGGGGDAIPIAPDASRLEGSLKVWDWESGKLQKTLVKKSDGYFRAVAFSQDSSRLVAGSTGPQVTRHNVTFVSSVVHCWEAKQWTRLWTVQGLYGDVWSLDISPDGQTVASSDDSGTSVIDAALGRVQGYRLITPQHVATEEFGAVRVVRRPDWPDGLVEAVDLDSRVYSRWDNGTESLFYRGRCQALNEALRKYAAVKGDIRQVVLLPGLANTQTLRGKPVIFDWQVRVPGGLDPAAARQKHAMMTVYISARKPQPVARQKFDQWLQDLNRASFPTRTAAHDELQKLGNDAKPLLRAALQAKPTLEMRRRVELLLDQLPSFDLSDVEIPKGTIVINVDDLIAKGLKELKDPDRNVRSLAIQDLSGLARFSDKIVPALVDVFAQDKDAHMRQVAAVCLANVGVRAKVAMPTLKKGLDDPDSNIRNACQNTLNRLASVEGTPDQQERIRRELAIVQEINELKTAARSND